MPPEELRRLRAALARTDEELLRGIGRRLELALQIGATKSRHRLPIRDAAVEAAVLRRWVEGLERFGVRPDSAERLARWLVEEAVAAQERPRRSADRPRTRPMSVLVIGGAGAMGRWLVDFFRARGDRPSILDPRAAGEAGGTPVVRDLGRAAREADLIVVATPMRRAAAAYRGIWRTGTRAIVVDVLSVKAPIAAEIRRGVRQGFRVGSLHPLFGPTARSLSGRNLLVLDCGNARVTRELVAIFRRSPLSVSVLPLAAHDRRMADLQVLPRLVALLFVATLLEGRRSPDELRRGETTSFHRQLNVAREVLAEDPRLGWDLLSLNPSAGELHRRATRALRRLGPYLGGRGAGSYLRLRTQGVTRLGSPSGSAPARAGTLGRTARSRRAR